MAMLERDQKRERDAPLERRRKSCSGNKVVGDVNPATRGGDDDNNEEGRDEMRDNGVRRSESKGAIKRQQKERKGSAHREQSLPRSHSCPCKPSHCCH